MIELARRIQPDALRDLMYQLTKEAAGGTLGVDLRDVEAIEGHAGPALAALLLSAFGNLEAEVQSPSAAELLARTGVAFALVNRPGKTTVVGRDATAQWPMWQESWVPGSRATVAALFSPAEVGESADAPNLIGERYASFVNPHLSRPSGERHEVVNLIHPWLRRLLPRMAGVGSLLDDLGMIVTELVENVRQHASQTSEARPAKSVVHVWHTRGAPNRVYVSVLDNGPGIVATATDKVVGGHQMDVKDLLAGLLLGKVARHNPARGFGLPDVYKVVDAHGAALWLSTADRLLTCDAQDLHVEPMPVDLGGTVVTMRFTLGA